MHPQSITNLKFYIQMKHNTHYNHTGDSGISGKHFSRLKRDNEFIEAYRQVLDLMLERGVASPRKAAIEFTVFNSRPHYHVSVERALVVVGRILSSGRNIVKPSLQALMWEEIASKVKQLVDKKGVSLSCAVQFVIDNCRASRFFVSPQYAYHHIRHLESNAKKQLL